MTDCIRCCLLASFFVLCIGPYSAIAVIIDFEDLNVFSGTSGNTDGQPGGQYYNGDTGVTNSLGFSSGGMYFSNSFTKGSFDSWSGFAYSNVVNTVSPGFLNQYAAIPGGGANGSGGVSAGANYGLLFSGGYLNVPVGQQLLSMEVTNTTYAHNSMRDGDAFAKKFGGASGTDPDFFRLNIFGFDAPDGTGNQLGTLHVALADFTSADPSQDFILDDWTDVDLSGLAGARSLSFSFESSDVGSFGINTPTYFALDNISLTAVPEPHSTIPVVLAYVIAHCSRRKRALNAIPLS